MGLFNDFFSFFLGPGKNEKAPSRNRELALKNEEFYSIFIFSEDYSAVAVVQTESKKSTLGADLMNQTPGLVLKNISEDQDISLFFKKTLGRDLIKKSDLYRFLEGMNSYEEKVLTSSMLYDSAFIPKNLNFFTEKIVTFLRKSEMSGEKERLDSVQRYFYSEGYYFVDSNQNFTEVVSDSVESFLPLLTPDKGLRRKKKTKTATMVSLRSLILQLRTYGSIGYNKNRFFVIIQFIIENKKKIPLSKKKLDGLNEIKKRLGH